jgi:predicted DCC family thiol-disulfide oxidoreductase YuxK
MAAMKEGMHSLVIYDENRFDNKRYIHFLRKNDKKKALCYVSMQSYVAQILVHRNNLVREHAPILVSGEKIFTSADVLVRTAPHLTGHWKALSLLRLLPRVLRNKTVNLILDIP